MSFDVQDDTPALPLDYAKVWEKCEWLTPKEFGLVILMLGKLWASPGLRIRADFDEIRRLFSNGIQKDYTFQDYEIENALSAFFWFHPREGFIYSRYLLELAAIPTKRQPIPSWMKQHALRSAAIKGGYVCAYCMDRPLSQEEIHFDHMLPISRGGINHPDNLAVCCAACNLSKGVLTNEEFEERISAAYREGAEE